MVTLATVPALAGNIVVTVLDRDGKPVPDVAVYLESPELAAQPIGRPSAVMDQYDKRFVPHLLIVQTGTQVEFPNSDTIAHHVYSFSFPNEFKLPIYKGDAYPPIAFTDSGVVILGCNIHDNMLGYILVVDTPAFAMTGPDGRATLDVDLATDARLSVWSPRIRDKLESLAVTVGPGLPHSNVTVQLRKSLRAPHDQQSETLSWSDY
jgi:plastocyanin